MGYEPYGLPEDFDREREPRRMVLAAPQADPRLDQLERVVSGLAEERHQERQREQLRRRRLLLARRQKAAEEKRRKEQDQARREVEERARREAEEKRRAEERRRRARAIKVRRRSRAIKVRRRRELEAKRRHEAEQARLEEERQRADAKLEKVLSELQRERKDRRRAEKRREEALRKAEELVALRESERQDPREVLALAAELRDLLGSEESGRAEKLIGAIFSGAKDAAQDPTLRAIVRELVPTVKAPAALAGSGGVTAAAPSAAAPKRPSPSPTEAARRALRQIADAVTGDEDPGATWGQVQRQAPAMAAKLLPHFIRCGGADELAGFLRALPALEPKAQVIEPELTQIAERFEADGAAWAERLLEVVKGGTS